MATKTTRRTRQRTIAGAARVTSSYRNKWTWDNVAWATHCVDCYPGSCMYHIYLKDGKVAFEEVAGSASADIKGVPDKNPMGCQKGAAWSRTLYGAERVLHPLRRVGERGAGNWEQVSWDEALEDIAEHILDAIQEAGPETIVHEMTPAEGGTMAVWPTQRLLVNLLGGVATDVNAVINDFQPGHYITWGKFNPASGAGSEPWTKLRLIWHCNPVYTQIPNYHAIAEGRYQGCEVVHIAPDAGPSSIHADYFFSVRPGTDAALALGMCRTIIEERLFSERFVKEQTDLPLLVRLDTKRFLRESDIEAGGSDEQFYAWDTAKRGIAKAPKTTLRWGRVKPALDARRRQVRLADGTRVAVVPAFSLLRERLNRDYTPQRASEVCGVNAEVIRSLARKVASKRTSIFMGMNVCKYYHGDLMQRAMLLLLGLTSNWGRLGSGIGSWSPGSGLEGQGIFSQKERPGLAETRRVLAMRAQLQQMTEAQSATSDTPEIAAIDAIVRATRAGMTGMVPPAFFWYHHCGYRERWNNPEWGDPTMRRSFDEYLQEASDSGWWEGVVKPAPDKPPRVLFEVGGNMLRRQRGGRTHLLQHLWPKLKLIVSVDWRMSTTGRFSDYVLPASQHYEKPNFHLASAALLQLKYSDNAAEPQGESLSEWDIFRLLAQKIEARAKERGLVEYTDSAGRAHRLDNLYYAMTLGIEDVNKLVDEWVRDTAEAGMMAKGESLKTMRKKGHADFTRVGENVYTLNQATDAEPGKPYTSLQWHTEKRVPYPTLTRRAQFYIDHPWFLEAGEELPVHKENPKMGGDYPLVLTSGHNRWSIHSMNITNRMLLQTHRGRPHLVMSPIDASDRHIADGEEVRVHNDVGSFFVPVKLSPSVMPGQVICYNGWDPYQFREWRGPMDVEPGMVKWLHMAGGYGHLRYWPIQWQPTPVDRAVRVDVAKIETTTSTRPALAAGQREGSRVFL
jgi:DMSO reductase family type II enzyme molybdopterin subunit